jgi:hypothetical protein
MLSHKFGQSLQSDDAGAVISELDDAIQTLVGMKRGLKQTKDKLDVASYEDQIKSIDEKLADMGGSSAYGSLPEGFMGTEKFMERYNQHSVAINYTESELLKVKQSRDILEERLGRLGQNEDRMLLQSNHRMDAQETHWQEQLNKQKDNFLDFLINNRPMDDGPYIEKKRKLLDTKLEILKKLRVPAETTKSTVSRK